MAEKLAERINPGEKVVFAGIQRVTMDCHLRRLGKPISAHSFPREEASHLGWYLDDMYPPEDPELISKAREHCPAEDGRTWLVATMSRMGEPLVDEIHRCAALTSPFLSAGEPYTAILHAFPRRSQDTETGPDGSD